MSGNPAVFDENKLLSINQVYIRRKSPEELAMLAAPMLAESGVATPEELERDMPRLTQIMDLLKERISRTTDIPDAVGYFYGGTLDYDPDEFEKQFGKDFVRENFPSLRAARGAAGMDRRGHRRGRARPRGGEGEGRAAPHTPLALRHHWTHRQRRALRDHAVARARAQPAEDRRRPRKVAAALEASQLTRDFR